MASHSIKEHLLRGAAGLVAAVLAIALLSSIGPVSLALLPITAFAWRGCPMCWTVGLVDTLAGDRVRGSCGAAYCRQAGRDASFHMED